MKIGIVGMPNAGKSSLFNALTRAGAQAANYPFTTVEPNVAVVGVPDERLEQVAATIGARPIVHETIQFHDIAGLVRGAHQGEGLGNKFLANIRETDAILHVVRAHDDPQVVHPEGRVDPLADVETIETELLYADLEQAERRLERVAKQAKSLDKVAVAEERWLRDVVDALREGRAVRTVPEPADAPGAAMRLTALTSKPVLYVANVAEGEPLEPPPALVAHAEERGARAAAVSARLDAELSELEEGEASAMREELGVAESGLEAVVRESFALLDLIQFFTAGQDKEGRAWAIPRGTRARQAAGAIHTDMERGFVAAEVTPWNALVDAGGYNAARERAQTRVEGREYAMQDGDVVTFRFTPS
ncbi:MAG: ribosome-binding ATPase [Thermoleophilaceae bacterium]|jgi:GTP-binding protein YchF|nr:ribosome-binding ATPase [Thermoleophilaceae bacterium]